MNVWKLYKSFYVEYFYRTVFYNSEIIKIKNDLTLK